MEEQEDGLMCGEEELRGSQAGFQRCTHSITGRLNEAVSEVTEADTVLIVLCRAVEDIRSECVGLLAACVDGDTLRQMARDRMDQLMPYLINIVEDKLEEPFSPHNCPNKTSRGVENETLVKSNEFKDTGPDYNSDEGETLEEPQSRNLVIESDKQKSLNNSEPQDFALDRQQKKDKTRNNRTEGPISGSDDTSRASFRAFVYSIAYSLITLYLF